MGLQIPCGHRSKVPERKLYGKFKRQISDIIKDLYRQRSVELLEGNLRADHIHTGLSVPTKFSIPAVIGFLKGKSAVRIHRYLIKSKQVKGKHFWSRGYCVSTVGLNEETIRKYIREQEEAERQQLDLDFE